jgi:hypothetical protein
VRSVFGLIVALPLMVIGMAFTSIEAIIGFCLTMVIVRFAVVISLVVEHQKDKGFRMTQALKAGVNNHV